jgi:N-methylhydantoinase A
MEWRIAVDVGGTFTDLVCQSSKGDAIDGKAPSTPDAPEQSVLRIVTDMVPKAVVVNTSFFLHSSTIGLNALLERKGARVGLLCTEGFRDVLEIRRGDRAEMFNLFWRPPEPLVPRYLRVGVAERMRADGTVDAPLDPESVRAAIAKLTAEGVESIAVCLMNAWANPEHEFRVLDLIRVSGFAGGVSLSHRISREYREYERTSTTVVDAYIRPRVSAYLKRLEAGLAGIGFRGQCLMLTSGGGALSFREASERPFETTMSGPVAGALGAGEIARTLGLEKVVTADVGGTSFDTTLISDGAPRVLFEGEIAGFPVQTSWVEVRSIGAGGGSIAAVDSGGLLAVGPRSAGAVPGPAAYARGGEEPTVTDAAVFLGMMGRNTLPSGVSLSLDRASDVLSCVAESIGRSIEDTAVGILRIATAGMANAIREITVEQGIDPREATLLTFGGAGPMLAVLLADELEMDRVVVPPVAGNFSAWGLLGADLKRMAAQTMLVPVDGPGVDRASAVLTALHDELDERGQWTGVVAGALLDLRYQGQEHWLSLAAKAAGRSLGDSPKDIAQRYEDEYRRRYVSTLDRPIEIVCVRATQTLPLRRPVAAAEARIRDRKVAKPVSWPAYSFAGRRRRDFQLWDRDRLHGRIEGPAIVTELTTSLYLDEGWQLEVGPGRELLLTRTRPALG